MGRSRLFVWFCYFVELWSSRAIRLFWYWKHFSQMSLISGVCYYWTSNKMPSSLMLCCVNLSWKLVPYWYFTSKQKQVVTFKYKKSPIRKINFPLTFHRKFFEGGGGGEWGEGWLTSRWVEDELGCLSLCKVQSLWLMHLLYQPGPAECLSFAEWVLRFHALRPELFSHQNWWTFKRYRKNGLKAKTH